MKDNELYRKGNVVMKLIDGRWFKTYINEVDSAAEREATADRVLKSMCPEHIKPYRKVYTKNIATRSKRPARVYYQKSNSF